MTNPSDDMRKTKNDISEFIVPEDKRVVVPENNNHTLRHGKAEWIGYRRFLNNVPGKDRIK